MHVYGRQCSKEKTDRPTAIAASKTYEHDPGKYYDATCEEAGEDTMLHNFTHQLPYEDEYSQANPYED